MTYSNFNYELLGELVRRLRGMAFEDAAREYIFEPLGMNDSYFALPESLLHRYVIRPPDAIGAEGSLGFPSLNSRAFHAAPNAGAGLCTTPFDMATFGQMILSGGALRGTRVLSRASVVAMSRDQIPGLEANMAGNRMKPASWSYGFAVESSFKWPYFRGSLSTLGSLCHPGACGSSFWIDPARELVACYVEVCMEISEDLLFLCNNDLFENVIQSAIDD